ncbi:hypothetical protein M0R01_04960 [bacterium]|nr:hypothetical protein [bacterium]
MINEKKSDTTLLKGKIRFELFDEKGNIKQVVEKDNTFMAVGDAHVADQLAATVHEAKMGWIAIGTSTTPFSAASTALTSELDRNALAAGYPEQGAAAADNDVLYKASWAAGDGTGAITEAGIFNSSADGTMLAASTFPVINKGASDTLTITWTVTCGAS